MSAKLRQELQADPLEKGYSTMTSTEVSTSLRTKDRPKNKVIGSAELLAWAGAGATDTINSRYERLKISSTDHTSPIVRGACLAGLKIVDRDDAQLDLSLQDRVDLVDALVTGSVISSAEKDELVEMGTQYVSRAQELGVKSRPGDVERSRI